ncbi:MAG: phosphoribosyltransferase family protein [Candidatus Eiseniibacteriota bacterium]
MWLDLALLFVEPARLEAQALALAGRLRPHGCELVCGPLVGGALIGQRVAAVLGIPFVFAERSSERDAPGSGVRYAIPRELRARVSGRRVAIVDDAINLGSATRACARAIASLGGRVGAVGALVLREGAAAELVQTLPVPIEAIEAIETMRWNTWPKGECALCARGVTLETLPGDSDRGL